ncbi:MAG TPA: alkaline phosphatase family protein [Verrucomicrobiae bacterium]|nr:alkaline phosphatase family protein [Verrucomicrobiae bacterium]
MLKSILRTAILITPLDLLGVIYGDPHLLSTGNYRLVLFLWATHLVFWLGFLALVTPIFLRLARGGARATGDETLAALLVGIVGISFAFGASVFYLHKDLGFFSPSRLPINAAVFLGAMLLAAVAFRWFRKIGEAIHRRRLLVTLVGLTAAAAFWITMFVLSRPNDVSLDIEALAISAPSAKPASTDGAPDGDATRKGNRVVLLGLDGADWTVIDPLIKAGALPNFATLHEKGVTAPEETISPFSPVVWTSIATGMDPGHHSVQYFSEMYSSALDMTVQRLNFNFLEPLYSRVFPKIPVSSTTRTSKALWEILSAFNRDSLVVNWWASFPAEPQRGVMISNYAIPWDEISAERIHRLTGGAQRVYPAAIWPDVMSVMEDTVKGGLATSSGEGTPLAVKVTNNVFWDTRDQIATTLFDRFDRREYSLSALYLQGCDTTSHHLSETVFGENMDVPRDAKVEKDVIEAKQAMLKAVYERMDALVGRQMTLLRPGDLLVVVSDHGWRYDGTSHWRKPDGIFALYGSGVRQGFSPGRIHVYDVAPTILYYLGLPISKEMPGKALEAAFTPAATALLPRVSVASYGPRSRPVRVADPEMDGEYRAKLKSLGYIQ